MSQKTLAGTPNVRYPDPLVKRINPDGTQPYSAYQASLVYSTDPGEYLLLLTSPPDLLAAELLLFGSDYPTKIAGVQQFEQQVYDENGTMFPVSDLALPIAPSPATALSDAVPSVLPSLTFDPYKKIATGATTTNGVTVSGFPAVAFVSGRNLWFDADGNAGVRAPYGVQMDVTLNGGVVDGPAAYVAYSTGSVPARVPVILHERELTQQIVDNGYIIENVLLGGNAATLDVVGLWASGGYTPPVRGLMRSFGLAPSSEPRESVYTRASALLAANNPE